MPKPLRIFISSPGDVAPERRCAALVIDKLRQEYGRFFDLQAYLWESEPMLASGHFQDAIEPPSASDILVLILWSRIGMPLPERTEKREYRGLDGRAPVTGTEWEYEEALAAQRARGMPTLLAYRKAAPIQAPLDDAERRHEAERQYEGLTAFIRRHFQEEGANKIALRDFTDLETFARLLEDNLRTLLRRAAEKVGPEGTAPTWIGAPYRRLLPYGPDDGAVFFGREAEIRQGIQRLANSAAAGTAFLAIVAGSGLGKSSLALSGIAARLPLPGVVEGVGLWRRAVMRPSGTSGDLFSGLAAALLAPEAIGAELAAGPFAAPGALAAALAATPHGDVAAAHPALVPIRWALERAEATARAEGKLLAFQSGRLLLVLDQLEELFTDPAVSAEARRHFLGLVETLANSGQVWVVATLRADFWHTALGEPTLAALLMDERRLDLLPPGAPELGAMVRGPARAAGLVFETDATTGISLDDQIVADASGQEGALPLLSFVLDELYQRDVVGRGGSAHALTFQTYAALGALEGAIGRAAEGAIADVTARDPEAAAALPQLLRRLVTARTGAAPAALAAPLDDFPEGSARRRLADALSAPGLRLLVAEGDAAGARLRLAHEALLRAWPTAREQVARDRRDYETREILEGVAARWREADQANKAEALISGLLLDEARDLCSRWAGDMSHSLLAFVEASDAAEQARRAAADRTEHERQDAEQRATRSRKRMWQAVATLSSLAFLMALGATVYVNNQRREAEEQRDVARRTLEAARGVLTDTVNTIGRPENFAALGAAPLQRDLVQILAPRFREVIGLSAEPSVRRTDLEAQWTLGRLTLRSGHSGRAVDIFRPVFESVEQALNESGPDPDLTLLYVRTGTLLSEALRASDGRDRAAEILARVERRLPAGQDDLAALAPWELDAWSWFMPQWLEQQPYTAATKFQRLPLERWTKFADALLRSAPSNPEYLINASSAHDWLARSFRNSDEMEGALRSSQRAVELAEQASALAPLSIVTIRQLARARMELARVQASFGGIRDGMVLIPARSSEQIVQANIALLERALFAAPDSSSLAWLLVEARDFAAVLWNSAGRHVGAITHVNAGANEVEQLLRNGTPVSAQGELMLNLAGRITFATNRMRTLGFAENWETLPEAVQLGLRCEESAIRLAEAGGSLRETAAGRAFLLALVGCAIRAYEDPDPRLAELGMLRPAPRAAWRNTGPRVAPLLARFSSDLESIPEIMAELPTGYVALRETLAEMAHAYRRQVASSGDIGRAARLLNAEIAMLSALSAALPENILVGDLYAEAIRDRAVLRRAAGDTAGADADLDLCGDPDRLLYPSVSCMEELRDRSLRTQAGSSRSAELERRAVHYRRQILRVRVRAQTLIPPNPGPDSIAVPIARPPRGFEGIDHIARWNLSSRGIELDQGEVNVLRNLQRDAAVRDEIISVPAPASSDVPRNVPADIESAPRNFLIFFDFGRTELTYRGRQLLDDYVERILRAPPSRIEIVGHLDRAEAEPANLRAWRTTAERLSRERAESAAAYLVSRGVARSLISTTGSGAEKPLIPTATGVREPQNRRAELTTRFAER